MIDDARLDELLLDVALQVASQHTDEVTRQRARNYLSGAVERAEAAAPLADSGEISEDEYWERVGGS